MPAAGDRGRTGPHDELIDYSMGNQAFWYFVQPDAAILDFYNTNLYCIQELSGDPKQRWELFEITKRTRSNEIQRFSRA